MGNESEIPEAPNGLHDSGLQLWRDVLSGYELDPHELLILKEACRTADRLDALAKEAEGGPLTTKNFKGDEVANPLLVESRQQSIVFSRLVASLRLPVEGPDDRPQRRGGARGVYQPRSSFWSRDESA